MARTKTVASQLEQAGKMLPERLKISPVKWRYAVWSALRGESLMLTGPTGCGKTMLPTVVAEVLKRPLFRFNMGATQDPRGALIGNTHFDSKSGTYLAPSEFIRAIQTDNAIVLLDEISRAHPDAWNILMTVLDRTQRYVRLDEAPDAPTIRVANGVSFFLTANIGSEYTGTRTLDRALQDRCQILEMDLLSKDIELELLTLLFPNVDKQTVDAVATIAAETRVEYKSESSTINTMISTRNTIQALELIQDGFTLADAAEVVFYPIFVESGGADSPRSHVRKIVQKYLPTDQAAKGDPWKRDAGIKPPWMD